MSITDEDTDALIRRRTLLDSTVMNLCLAGVEVPRELEAEFIAVQDELIRRGRQSLPDPPRTWTNWLGKSIGDYKIEYMMEEGIYWYLFHANQEGVGDADPALGGSAMIKVAKEVARYGTESGKMKFASRAFAIDGDIVREVQPAQDAIIEAEIRRFAGTTSGALPVLEEEAKKDHCRYYRAPHIAGDSLRQLLLHCDAKEDAFSIVSIFSQIAGTLDQLCSDPSFIYHGNLKPENMIFTAGGVLFRELGYFGTLACAGGVEPEVRITSPQYYPWLDIDDIGALGICLWEALIDYHPFDDSRPAGGDCVITADLRALVDLELSLANMFVLPLLSLKRPHQLGVRTSEKLEQVLFKSIKLKIGDDGLLHEDPGYQSMAHFNQDLLELLNQPKMIF